MNTKRFDSRRPAPRPIRSTLVRAIGLSLASVLLLALTGDLHAQAGGGGSYGGGGGGGGGGDGGAGVWIIFELIRFAIRMPAVGVPVLIVGGVVVYWATKEGWFRHETRVIRRAAAARAVHHARVSAEPLQAVDPGFQTETFLARARSAFTRAQEAWCAQDLRPLRAFVSDGVYERFSLQIEEQKREGWRQGMDDLAVEGMSIIHVHTDAHFDTVTVKIQFRSRIHRISLETGKSIPRSELPRHDFVECWSFLRRRGAQSIRGDGLIEGRCPNCSAPLEMNAAARCQGCNSLLRSGEHDWVLAEITQACEWQSLETERVPGLAELRKSDPDLNLQHLEDRGSVMFWRKATADTRGRVDPLLKVASQTFCQQYAKELDKDSSGSRTFVGDCAVGSVGTVGLFEEDGVQRAIVEVRWDGRPVKEEKGERRVEDRRTLRRSVFVLRRAAGARTDIGHSVTSSHCPSCGAPDEGGTGHACGYCGTVLNRGDLDWVLEGIHARMSEEGQALLRRARGLTPASASSPAPEAAAMVPSLSFVASASALEWTVKMALADGDVHAKEREALETLADKCEVPRERLEALIADIEAGSGSLETSEPDGQAEARQWLDAMVHLAAADGEVSKAEMKLLEPMGARLNYTAIDLRNMVRKEQRRLYMESRERLRAERAAARA